MAELTPVPRTYEGCIQGQPLTHTEPIIEPEERILIVYFIQRILRSILRSLRPMLDCFKEIEQQRIGISFHELGWEK